mgnify:CR=1 FL=1
MNTAVLYHINAINWSGLYLGTVIGRYPEDTYDGMVSGRYPEDTYDGMVSGSIGNPWFLTTNALGEYYYRLFIEINKQRSFKVTDLNKDFFVYLTSDHNSLIVGNTYSVGSKAYDHIYYKKLMHSC